MMYALIQEDDVKSEKLAKEIDGIELFKMKGSTNLIPVHLVNQILKRKKKPKALVLRYLNDSNTFVKSLIRLITNTIAVLLAKLLGIKLIWICHNVDRESKVNYPLLVKIRRKMVTYLSDKILVTDKLLIEHAVRLLKVDRLKVDYLTFGRPQTLKRRNVDDYIYQKIIRFVENTEDENSLIGYSIGNPNLKVLQPFYTDRLIKTAAKNGINIKIILGGPIGEFIKKHDFNEYKKIISNPNILFLDGKVRIDEEKISQYIDFYWRVYDDYSVPFTVYNAVYLNKPILTMDKGFLKEMVTEYDLGTVLENDMSDIVRTIDGLKRDRTKSFEKFKDTHNWSIGAKQLYKVIQN